MGFGIGTVSARYEVREDNTEIALDVFCTARDADLDPSTDGSADRDETPVRLTVCVYCTENGMARTRLSVAALGLTLQGALRERAPTFIEYEATRYEISCALDRVAPEWPAWAGDAERQLEAEHKAGETEDGHDEDSWLDALNERPVAVFGCGV